MTNRTTRALKIVVAIIAVLVFGIIGGMLTTISADEAQNDIAIIKTENYRNYTFTKEGYKVDSGDIVPHTGTYFIYGEANTDITFLSSEGETVSFDVILHSWNATAREWNALLNVGMGVTLNITVRGENVIKGDNHPGIKMAPNSKGEGAPIVNLNIEENSKITVGYQYMLEQNECIDSDVTLHLNEGVGSSLDMSTEDWRTKEEVQFYKGEGLLHKYVYTYIDDDICRVSCDSCAYVTSDIKHDVDYIAYDSTHEDYDKKHYIKCVSCNHEFEIKDHSIRYTIEEDTHAGWCNYCNYAQNEVQHAFDETGCTVCGEKFIASHTVDGETTKYLTIEGLQKQVEAKGGLVTLLGNIESSFGFLLYARKADVVVDLAGFELSGVAIKTDSGYTAKIIDSSEKKTGIWTEENWSGSYIEGEVIFEDVTIGSANIRAYNGGKITIKNVTFNEDSAIGVWEGSSAEIINVVALKQLSVGLDASNVSNVNIYSGSFGEIVTRTGTYDEVAVNQLLRDGYAYSGENGILDGTKTEIKGVTSIVEHAEHDDDTIHKDGKFHWQGCACGFCVDDVKKEAHSIDESGNCPICSGKIVASVSDDIDTFYFLSIETAIEKANALITSTVKLLANITVRETDIINNIQIDLNGYTLFTNVDRIYVYGTLTITDTSEEKDGMITSLGDIGYMIQIQGTGRLVINEGSFFGLIYTNGNESKEIVINGGKFTGTDKFRISNNTTLIINGGWFENKNGTINFWSNSNVTVIINGGVFANGSIAVYDSTALSVSDVLGTDGTCSLILVNELGKEVELENLSQYIDGIIIVAHKDAELIKDDIAHSLVCKTCEKEIYLREHYNFTYAINESDNTLHIKTCAGCDYVATEKHIGGSATCTSLAVCELCENGYGDLNPQNHSGTETKYVQSTSNPKEHSLIYVCCNQIKESSEHTGGSATCKDKAVCEACNIAYGSLKEHTYKNKCDKDCDVCKVIRTVGNHIYDNENDTSCNECGYVKSSQLNNGVDIDELDDQDNKGLSTGAIVGIVLGSIAILGGGGFAIVWFVVIKKKP